MHERSSPQNSNDILNRTRQRSRNIAYGLLVASSIAIAGGIDVSLNNGWHLFPPGTHLEKKRYSCFDGVALIGDEEFLVLGKTYEWSHRSGNTIKNINEAVDDGANLLDVDLRYVNGELYTVHGLAFSPEIFGKHYYFIIDPTEGKLKREQPPKFEDIIKHIASLSIKEKRKIGVYIDIKPDDENVFCKKALEKMIDILLENNVPAIIQPKTKERLDYIRTYYVEKTGLSATFPSASYLLPKAA
jgi:hypothetical protein